MVKIYSDARISGRCGLFHIGTHGGNLIFVEDEYDKFARTLASLPVHRKEEAGVAEHGCTRH